MNLGAAENMASDVTSRAPGGSLWSLIRYFFLYGYAILVCTVFRSRKYGVLGLWRLTAVRPSALLRGFRSDLYTLLYRMEQRCNVLPSEYRSKGVPLLERESSGNLRESTRLQPYMKDIGNFLDRYPLATQFDVRLFHEGWAAGFQSGLDMCGTEAQKSRVGIATLP